MGEVHRQERDLRDEMLTPRDRLAPSFPLPASLGLRSTIEERLSGFCSSGQRLDARSPWLLSGKKEKRTVRPAQVLVPIRHG